ncbi:MAG TPA: hypothetical protein PKC92_02395 [Bacteroidia bacterium]|jgi:hypothetical protein|nr:hypothetical protein [Bacteroidia bacterium]
MNIKIYTLFLMTQILANSAICQSLNTIPFFNQTQINTAFGIGKFNTLYFNGYEYSVINKERTFTLESTNGFKFKKHHLGISIGIDKWNEALLFPVCVSYQLNLIERKLHPLILASTGYSFGKKNKTEYDNSEDGSLNFKVSFGAEVNIHKKFSFLMGINYKFQNMRSYYKRIVNPYEPQTKTMYNVHYHFLGILIGIKFVNNRQSHLSWNSCI